MTRTFILKIDDFRMYDGVSKILNLIDHAHRLGIPCSVGVIGSCIQSGRGADIIKMTRAIAEGRVELWNHSWSHKDFTSLQEPQMIAEVLRCQDACESLFGVVPKGLGFPYNKCDERVRSVMGRIDLDYIYEYSFTDAKTTTPEAGAIRGGQVSIATIKTHVTKLGFPEQLIVQVHPTRWTPTSQADFLECLAWLRSQGYAGVLPKDWLAIATRTDANRLRSMHEFRVRQLVDCWTKRAPGLSSRLSNFSSYFLGRFSHNALPIRSLLKQLDADLEFSVVVDVGCGLGQWGLPFISFSNRCTVHGFDTNAVIAEAMNAAKADGALPNRMRFHHDDFTSSSQVPAGSVDRFVCANALNYMPMVAFASKAKELAANASFLILLNQTAAFNRIGYRDALSVGNTTGAMERALVQLRQILIGHGFSGYADARQTPVEESIAALLQAFGFFVWDAFTPPWESLHRGQPTFAGQVFKYNPDFKIEQLPADRRLQIRRAICRGGWSEFEMSAFSSWPEDLKRDRELSLLHARSGIAKHASPLSVDANLGKLVRQGQHQAISDNPEFVAGKDTVWRLAAIVSGLIAGRSVPMSQLGGLEPLLTEDEDLRMLRSLCLLASGDSSGAKRELGT